MEVDFTPSTKSGKAYPIPAVAANWLHLVEKSILLKLFDSRYFCHSEY